MEYYSVIKKNKIMSFSGKEMELEITILSGVTQTLKDKYHIFPIVEVSFESSEMYMYFI